MQNNNRLKILHIKLLSSLSKMCTYIRRVFTKQPINYNLNLKFSFNNYETNGAQRSLRVFQQKLQTHDLINDTKKTLF